MLSLKPGFGAPGVKPHLFPQYPFCFALKRLESRKKRNFSYIFSHTPVFPFGGLPGGPLLQRLGAGAGHDDGPRRRCLVGVGNDRFGKPDVGVHCGNECVFFVFLLLVLKGI